MIVSTVGAAEWVGFPPAKQIKDLISTTLKTH